MAAAEYYNPSGLGAPSASSPQHHHHSPQPAHAHPSQQHLNPPYPISDAPPPYEEISSSHTSAPRPSSSNNQYRPSSSSQYPDDKPPAPPGRPQNGSPSNIYANPNLRPSRDSLGYSAAPYPQQPLPPTSHPAKPSHLRPDYNASTTNLSPAAAAIDAAGRRPTSTPPKLHGILKNKHDTSPYHEPPRSRSRSRSSSRDRHRRRRHHSRHHSSNNGSSSHQRYDSHQSNYAAAPNMPPRPNESSSQQLQSQKKGNSVKTFLGAGGGALIGDCIFPGLGTIGGAILGGLGGHEYGKRSKEISSAGRDARDTRDYPREGGYSSRPRAYSNDDDYHHYREERRRGRKH